MKNLNKVIINFLLPIFIVYLAFRFNSLIGMLIVLGFLIFALVKSRSDVFAHIGNMQYIKGKEEAAFKWIKKAAQIKKCQPKVSNAYGFLLLKRGEIDQAETVLNGVVNSGCAKDIKLNARTYLALVEWKKGRLFNAIRLLEEIYHDFKNTNIYSNLGFLLILRGDLEKALSFNLEAYDYNNTSNTILNNLAQTYYLTKQFNEAENLYRKLLLKDPNFADPYFYLGLTLLELDKREEAKKMIQMSQKFNISFLSTLTTEKIRDTASDLEK